MNIAMTQMTEVDLTLADGPIALLKLKKKKKVARNTLLGGGEVLDFQKAFSHTYILYNSLLKIHNT